MHCKYCGAEIARQQTRCPRCQHRVGGGTHPEARQEYLSTALAPAPRPAEDGPDRRFTVTEGGGAARRQPAIQPPLFPEPAKVVGLQEYLPAQAPRRRPPAGRSRVARQHPGQIAFDFEAAARSARQPEEARQCYPVAPLLRRAFACAADLAVAAGVGLTLFLGTVRLLLGGLPQDRLALLAGAGILWILTGIYHALYAASGRPSVGQRLAQLRLVTMEGRRGEPAHRVKRVMVNVLLPPVCVIGTVWAALTEEKYSWTDHITHTYLTPAESRL